MDSDKSPGSDGLPADFYKAFWNSISDLLLKAFNYVRKRTVLRIAKKRHHKIRTRFS